MGLNHILTVFVLLLLMPIPVLAEDPVSDAASWAIEKGIQAFVFSVGDNIMATTNSTTEDRNVMQGIIKVIGQQPNPLKDPIVIEWNKQFLVFYVLILIMTVIIGGIMVIIGKLELDFQKHIAFLGVFDFQAWIHNILLGIILLLFGSFFAYYAFEVQNVLAALLVTPEVDAIVPLGGNNPILYLFSAFLYIILAIFLGIKNIILLIFAASLYGIFALIVFQTTRDVGLSLLGKAVGCLMLSPVIGFIYAVCTMIIKTMPDYAGLTPALIYIIMMILIVLTSVTMIFKLNLFENVKRLIIMQIPI